MKKEDFEQMERQFADGDGYGSPDARENAKLKVQISIAKDQSQINRTLNRLTGLLVLVGLINATILFFKG